MEQKLPTKYQLRPNFRNKFKPQEVKKLVRNLLVEKLTGISYQSEIVANLTKDLANIIRDRITSDLNYDRYKFVVNVFIGEQKGEGVKMGCRCFWDEDTDNYTSEVFMNNQLFCVVSVFGVYNY